MRTARMLVLGATLIATACSDDDTTAQPSSSSSVLPDDRRYAVLLDESWALQEAIDPPADAPVVATEQPPLEWYADYTQSSPNTSAMVRLSGHRATFTDTRSALEDLGFTLVDVSLQRWRAAGGSAPDDPASPAVIVLDNGPTTLMVLSYEQNLDQLAAIADDIESVDRPTWTAAGGVIQ